MRRYAVPLGWGTLGFVGLVSLMTPFQDPVYFERWFNLPGSLYTFVVPMILVGASILLFRGLAEEGRAVPLCDQLYRHRDQLLPPYGATRSDDLGRSRAG